MDSPLLTKISQSSGANATVLVGPMKELQDLTALLKEVPEVELWHFSGRDPAPEEINQFSSRLEEQVSANSLKRLSLLGVSWGGPICIQYASAYPRNMRRLVLVDAKARQKQGELERVIEWIEGYLPLGFPLRPLSKAFDPRPLLHRVRCPVLVLTTRAELREDAEFLAARIPNVWKKEVNVSEIAALFESFLEVQTKQPQRRAAA